MLCNMHYPVARNDCSAHNTNHFQMVAYQKHFDSYKFQLGHIIEPRINGGYLNKWKSS